MQQSWFIPSGRRLSAFSTLVFPLLLNCSAGDPRPLGEESEEPAGSSEPLVNGQPSKEPYAGIVRPSGCTASLIGRQTALTAAHCVKDGEPTTFCSFPCGNINSCAGTCVSGVAERFPGYSGGLDFDHDVAVVRLSRDFTALSGVRPILIGGPVQRKILATLVGYGCTDSDHPTVGLGQQRVGQNRITGINDETFDYEDESLAYSCEGDSGGPAMTRVNCEVGVIVGWRQFIFWDKDYVLSRIDTKVSWIQETARDPSVHECSHTVCGDGLCQFPETKCSCATDCPGACPPPPKCGDGLCNGTETLTTCPSDCPPGICSGETADCCSDGVCRSATMCKNMGCL